MNCVKAVIFDWGGVLIEDPAPGLVSYCAGVLGINEGDYCNAYAKFMGGFQTGLVREDQFWHDMAKHLNVPVPDSESLWLDAFTATYKPRSEVFALAGTLRQRGCKTALLSNTEVPAMRYFMKQGYDMFDATVFSCAEGLSKPTTAIYELVISRLAVKPQEAIFIDDNPEYIAGAKKAGLNTILFESIEQVKDDLADFGVNWS